MYKSKSIALIVCMLLISFAYADDDMKLVRCKFCDNPFWVPSDAKEHSATLATLGTDEKPGYVCNRPKCAGKARKQTAIHEQTKRQVEQSMEETIREARKIRRVKNKILGEHLTDFSQKWKKIDDKNQEEATKQQIAIMEQQINEANFVDTWCLFASYANLEAIKHFWPSPDDKTILDDGLKRYNDRVAEEKENGGRVVMEIFGGFMQKALEAGCGIKDVETAMKKAPAAFAIGRDPQTNEVRFVDDRDFSLKVLAYVVISGDVDNLKYLLKQCGGLDNKTRMDLLDECFDIYVNSLYAISYYDGVQKIAQDPKNKQLKNFLESEAALMKVDGLKSPNFYSIGERIIDIRLRRECLALILKGANDVEKKYLFSKECAEKWMKRNGLDDPMGMLTMAGTAALDYYTAEQVRNFNLATKFLPFFMEVKKAGSAEVIKNLQKTILREKKKATKK